MMKGAGGTSGGVNFVRKRGEYTPHTQLSLSAGTWDNYRGQIDTGGPLNDTGSVRGAIEAYVQAVKQGRFPDNAVHAW